MKSLLIYLAMVGLPLAGLFGILRAGSRLDAPHSIGGSWRMQAPAPPGDLELSQSGVHVVVEMGGVRMRGEVRGDSLVASAPPAAGAPGAVPCGAHLGRDLRARIDRAAEPDRVTGVVEVPGRADCPSSTVRAVRAPATKRGGRH